VVLVQRIARKTYSSIDRCSKFKGLLLLPLQATTNEEAALQGDETENGEFSLAPLNGRQSVRIYRKDAKVEEHERKFSRNVLNE